ncbi:MAG: DUF2312 domain-containing protein [Reyranellaceae bacterium]
MSDTPISAGRLKSFVERIEKLNEERKAIGGDIRDVYAEAKGVGYDVPTIRRVVKLREKDAADLAEEEALLDTYRLALGMEHHGLEEQAEKRVDRRVAEVRRCMKLSNNGQPPRIDAIMRELGCSSGKASTIRKQCEELLAAAVSISAESTRGENETPHDPETGEVQPEAPDMGNPISTAPAVSRETDPDIMARAARWAASSDTGASSKAILGVMTGAPPKGWYCYPSDSDDFGRCARLLEAVPEWRPRIGEMVAVGPEWGAIAGAWDELDAMHKAGEPLHRRIRELVRPHEDKRNNLVRMGEGTTVVFGDDLSIPDILKRERAPA